MGHSILPGPVVPPSSLCCEADSSPGNMDGMKLMNSATSTTPAQIIFNLVDGFLSTIYL